MLPEEMPMSDKLFPCIPALHMIFQHPIARVTPSTSGYGRAGCIFFCYLQFGLVWCIPFHSQQYWRAGCLPFHRQQYGRALVPDLENGCRNANVGSIGLDSNAPLRWLSTLMKCTDFIMNSKQFCLLISVIVSQLIKPSPFTSYWFILDKLALQVYLKFLLQMLFPLIRVSLPSWHPLMFWLYLVLLLVLLLLFLLLLLFHPRGPCYCCCWLLTMLMASQL